MVDINQIKKLREETGISISECKKALEEAKGDFKRAKEILTEWGKKFAAGKKEKETEQGIISSYVHSNKRVGAMVQLHCESDFVARSEGFQKLAHELCLQIAAVDPDQTPLLSQPWIKDQSKTIKDLIEEYISKFGENITIKRYVRFEV